MREIDADLDELIRLHGEGDRHGDFHHYLDVETGEIVWWTDPMLSGEENEYELEELEVSERHLYVPEEESREGWDDTVCASLRRPSRRRRPTPGRTPTKKAEKRPEPSATSSSS